MLNLAATPVEREWMSIVYSFFCKGYNLEGKSSSEKLPRVHKPTPMLWRKGLKL
jgi:hypothetical protein